MAKITEKRLLRVSPQSFTGNGTFRGEIPIADPSLFVVGHIIKVESSTQPTQIVKIKRITPTHIMVGRTDKPIHDRLDMSMFLAVDLAIIYADEQNRPTVPEQEIERNTYDEEPVVARRVSLIDKFGDRIDDSNPLPVAATVVQDYADTPTIFNSVAVSANTEYTQVIPNNTLSLILRARNSAVLQLSYVPGTTNTNYLTVFPGGVYIINNVKLVGKTIYFRSNKANTVIEMECWT